MVEEAENFLFEREGTAYGEAEESDEVDECRLVFGGSRAASLMNLVCAR